MTPTAHELKTWPEVYSDVASGLPDKPTPHGVRLLMDIALSELIARAANLSRPIDFQIQSMTEANVPEHGVRNPMGIRHE